MAAGGKEGEKVPVSTQTIRVADLPGSPSGQRLYQPAEQKSWANVIIPVGHWFLSWAPPYVHELQFLAFGHADGKCNPWTSWGARFGSHCCRSSDLFVSTPRVIMLFAPLHLSIWWRKRWVKRQWFPPGPSAGLTSQCWQHPSMISGHAMEAGHRSTGKQLLWVLGGVDKETKKRIPSSDFPIPRSTIQTTIQACDWTSRESFSCG